MKLNQHSLKRYSKQQQGFTLIELLVAMFITAIIGAMAFSSVSTAIRAIESMEVRGERLTELNTFFFRLAKDMRFIVPRGANINGQIDPALKLNAFESDGLSFTSVGGVNPMPDKIPRSNLQRINYSLSDGNIVRKRWTAVDRVSDDKVQEQKILTGVQSVKIRFVAPAKVELISGRAPSLRWIDDWPSASTQSAVAASSQSTTTVANTLDILPMAMEITVELDPWGEIVRVFEIGGEL